MGLSTWMEKWEAWQYTCDLVSLENLVVDILLGPAYMDCCMKGNYPMDRRIAPLYSPLEATLARNRDLSKIPSILLHKAPNKHSQVHAAILVAKQITILPEEESPVTGVTSPIGHMIIEWIQMDKPTNRLLHARGTKEVRTHAHSECSSRISWRNWSGYRKYANRGRQWAAGDDDCTLNAETLIWTGR